MAAVVDDVVDDHADAAGVRFLQQGAHVVHAAVVGLDAEVVGGGVAVVAVSAALDGHQPQAADAQVLQHIQARDQAPRSPTPSPSLSWYGARRPP